MLATAPTLNRHSSLSGGDVGTSGKSLAVEAPDVAGLAARSRRAKSRIMSGRPTNQRSDVDKKKKGGKYQETRPRGALAASMP